MAIESKVMPKYSISVEGPSTLLSWKESPSWPPSARAQERLAETKWEGVEDQKISRKSSR